jgi:geranylgeranyl diphosphate synthase type II
MRELEIYQHAIEKKISELEFPKNPENLYDPIRYFLDLGGKRMRPVLLLMSHEMFGGDHKNVVSPALAIELFHNFSLVHDDIMDKAALRRGKATVHEKWNTNTAILAGDAILIESYKLMMDSPIENLKSALSVFNQTALEVCEGQVMDMDFEIRNDVSIAEYIEMIRLKTAVLLGGSLEIGAILANASKDDYQHIYEFGINLGIAFQLHDDILDVYADPDKFGKTVGGDIASNKKTFLLLKTLELVNDFDKKHLESLLHLYHENKIQQVMSLYDKYQVKSLAEGEMKKYFDSAMNHLEKIKVSPEKKQPLILLANFLMQRES